MKKQFFLILLAAVCCFILTSCSKKEPSLQSSQVWETAPSVEFGVLSPEGLQVLSWDTGRCEATSFYRMAETENGFYLLYAGKLFYADKEGLSSWLPVCGKPDCSHGYASTQCDATLGGNSIIVNDGRIFFIGDLQSYPDQYHGSGAGKGIFSKAPDGSDTQLEYFIEEALIYSGGSESSLLTPEYWIYSSRALQPDGSKLARVYCRTEENLAVLYSETQELGGSRTVFTYIPGDRTFYNAILDPTGFYALRLDGETVASLDLSGYWDTACYLSGNTLRIFRENEGYFDVRLEEGTETPVAQCRLENSRVFMPLPNCVLETNLGTLLPSGTPGCSMEFYNGTGWIPVTVSDDVKNMVPGSTLSVLSVTSHRVFLVMTDMLHTYLCQIVLGTDTPTLELCAKLDVY